MKWLEGIVLAIAVALLSFLTLSNVAHGAEIRPEGAPRGEGVSLGQCSPPRPWMTEGGVVYIVTCSSGAMIVLPRELVERGEDGPLFPFKPGTQTSE